MCSLLMQLKDMEQMAAGFFERTVRSDSTFACDRNRACRIKNQDKRKCAYCRFQNGLDNGMRPVLVQIKPELEDVFVV